MQVQYLEIVTPEADATCAALATQHGVRFSEPQASLGNARIAMLAGGGHIGVRKPYDEEDPVVRPYMLVKDIEAASIAAEDQGAEFAMRPTEIPGRGTFAIYFLGGIQQGLWAEPENAVSEEKFVQIQYLEIVTPEVDETCATLATQHGVRFSAPEARLGNAHIAMLAGGGRIGVREMMGGEEPAVNPYMLVKDIEAATIAAEDQGAEFVMRAREIPGQGTLAIYFLGDIQHGLWQID